MGFKGNRMGKHGNITHMQPMVLVYKNLHDWVILFGQVLVNIPAPWSIWIIIGSYLRWFFKSKRENMDILHMNTLMRRSLLPRM